RIARNSHWLLTSAMTRTTPISVWVGTRKGAFRCRSTNRKRWDIDGPFFKGWEVNHVAPDLREPKRVYAAVNSAWFGPHIHASENSGKTWKPSDEGFALKSLSDAKLARAWHIEAGQADQPGVVWAGADPGALFRSEDWGKNWQEVTSFNTHPTRSQWTAGGGMMVHSIQCLSKDRVIVGMSVAGVRCNSSSAIC